MIFFWSGFAVRHARSFLCDALRCVLPSLFYGFSPVNMVCCPLFFRKFAGLKALKIRRARGVICALILQ